MIRDLLLIVFLILSVFVAYETGWLVGFGESSDMYEAFLHD